MLAINASTTQTRYGTMHYYAEDVWVGRFLETYGEYSESEVEVWRHFVKSGDTVLDIGANIGALTLPLAEMVGEAGYVLAFEPQPQSYTLLARNCASRPNISTFNQALSDHDGTVHLAPLSDIANNNFGGYEVREGKPDDDLVKIERLDSYKLDKVAFMKVDVEGMELQVLKGAVSTIKRCRPFLYVENDRTDKSEQLIRFIRGLGYRLFEHRPKLYSPANYKNAPPSPVPGRPSQTDDMIVSINLLCVPDELPLIIEPSKDMVEVAEMSRPIISNKEWACVVRLGGIGDDLIAASTLRPLKKLGYKIEVISQEPQCVVFENNPFVDKLTIKDSQRDIPQGNQMEWQKYWWARSCEYARFANLSHSMEVLLAQFPESTAFWWPPEMRRKMCGQSYLEAAHDVVGVDYDFGPMFFPTAAEIEDIQKLFKRHKLDSKPKIAWTLSGTRLDKVYPQTAMAIARLISELGANVLMLSAPHPHADGSRAKQVLEHVELTNGSNAGLYDIRTITEARPEWPIRRMLTLAQMCDLVIGPDTGPMWSVAMEPVPKIMLHSHASVENITKHWHNTISLQPTAAVKCWPCHLLHREVNTCQETQKRSGLRPDPEAHGAACIGSITVNRIIDAAKQQLLKGGD